MNCDKRLWNQVRSLQLNKDRLSNNRLMRVLVCRVSYYQLQHLPSRHHKSWLYLRFLHYNNNNLGHHNPTFQHNSDSELLQTSNHKTILRLLVNPQDPHRAQPLYLLYTNWKLQVHLNDLVTRCQLSRGMASMSTNHLSLKP